MPNEVIDPVKLVRDVADFGVDKAPTYPRLRTQAHSVELVIHDDVAKPGVLMLNGSVLVLSWNQMRALRDALDPLCQLCDDMNADKQARVEKARLEIEK